MLQDILFIPGSIVFMILEKIYERLALNNLILNKYEKSEKYFLKIKKKNPHMQGINFNLGIIKFAKKEFLEAEKYFLNEIKLFGETYERLKSVADLYYVWGQREKCNTNYKKALRLCESKKDKQFIKERLLNSSDSKSFKKVKESNFLFEEGCHLMNDERFDEAKKSFFSSIELDKTNFIALNNLGSIFLNHDKDYLSAADSFEKALEYSDLPILKNNLSLAKQDQEKLDEKKR